MHWSHCPFHLSSAQFITVGGSIVCLHGKSLQSCPTLCEPMDCSPPGSSAHGILQERILEWVAMTSSRGSSQAKDQTSGFYVSCIGRQGFFTTSATWEMLIPKHKLKSGNNSYRFQNISFSLGLWRGPERHIHQETPFLYTHTKNLLTKIIIKTLLENQGSSS